MCVGLTITTICYYNKTMSNIDDRNWDNFLRIEENFLNPI